jgi:hypothetical protein
MKVVMDSVKPKFVEVSTLEIGDACITAGGMVWVRVQMPTTFEQSTVWVFAPATNQVHTACPTVSVQRRQAEFHIE